MDLWQLHIYCKLVELRSFSKTGESVHLSQPTISSHIKDLESYFECKLIDRLTKEAVPTKAGELLYQHAKKILKAKDEMESSLSEFFGNMKGMLAVGGSTIPGSYVFPKIIGEYKKKFPSITISLSIAATEKIIEDVANGKIEIAIVGAETQNAQIKQTILLADYLKLIVSPDHIWAKKKNIPINQLMEQPLIRREQGSGTLKSLQEIFQSYGVNLNHLNTVAEMGSTEAVIQGIKNHVGVSFLSELAVEQEVRHGSLVALDIYEIPLKRYFYITYNVFRTLSPIGKNFLSFIESRKWDPKTDNKRKT